VGIGPPGDFSVSNGVGNKPGDELAVSEPSNTPRKTSPIQAIFGKSISIILSVGKDFSGHAVELAASWNEWIHSSYFIS